MPVGGIKGNLSTCISKETVYVYFPFKFFLLRCCSLFYISGKILSEELFWRTDLNKIKDERGAMSGEIRVYDLKVYLYEKHHHFEQQILSVQVYA